MNSGSFVEPELSARSPSFIYPFFFPNESSGIRRERKGETRFEKRSGKIARASKGKTANNFSLLALKGRVTLCIGRGKCIENGPV